MLKCFGSFPALMHTFSSSHFCHTPLGLNKKKIAAEQGEGTKKKTLPETYCETLYDKALRRAHRQATGQVTTLDNKSSLGINDRRAMAETVARHSKKPDGKTGEENDVKKEVEMSTPAAAGSRLSIFSSKKRKHS